MKSPRLAQMGRAGLPTNLALRQSRYSVCTAEPSARPEELGFVAGKRWRRYVRLSSVIGCWMRCAQSETKSCIFIQTESQTKIVRSRPTFQSRVRIEAAITKSNFPQLPFLTLRPDFDDRLRLLHGIS